MCGYCGGTAWGFGKCVKGVTCTTVHGKKVKQCSTPYNAINPRCCAPCNGQNVFSFGGNCPKCCGTCHGKSAAPTGGGECLKCCGTCNGIGVFANPEGDCPKCCGTCYGEDVEATSKGGCPKCCFCELHEGSCTGTKVGPYKTLTCEAKNKKKPGTQCDGYDKNTCNTFTITTSSQPQITGDCKLFKINYNSTDNKYFFKNIKCKIQKNETNNFAIVTYNASNFFDKQCYLQSTNTINFITGDKTNYVFITPFTHRANDCNVLTTALSIKLIEKSLTSNKLQNEKYNEFMLKFSYKIMKLYINSLAKYIKNKYKANSTQIKKIIKCLISHKKILVPLYYNVYIYDNMPEIKYCHKLHVKILFVRNTIINHLKLKNVVPSEYENNLCFERIFYCVMWKSILKNNKIKVSQINKAFNEMCPNLLDKKYNIIFKNWFNFIDNNSSMYELLQIEISGHLLSEQNLLESTKNNYLTNCEKFISIDTIKYQLNIYLEKMKISFNRMGENPNNDNIIQPEYDIYNTIDTCYKNLR